MGLASGAALGGISGAALSGREVAPVATGLGSIVGTIPFFAVTAPQGKADDRFMVPSMILPIIGTFLGNEWGQK